MDALSYSSLRQNLAQAIDRVCQDHEPLIVTRQRKESVVLMSLDDFESLQETAYLLRAPKNARRLLESIHELEQGHGAERDLLE